MRELQEPPWRHVGLVNKSHVDRTTLSTEVQSVKRVNPLSFTPFTLLPDSQCLAQVQLDVQERLIYMYRERWKFFI